VTRLLAFLLVGCSTAPLPRSLVALRATGEPELTLSVIESDSTLFIYRKPGGVSVQWIAPTNVWLAEWSTNLVDWTRASDGVALDGSNRHVTEADTWADRWFLRLRRWP